MDNIRLLLIMALAYTGFLLWQAWQEDYGQPAGAATEQVAGQVGTPGAGAEKSVPEVPSNAAVDKAVPASGTAPSPEAAVSGKLIEVVTDTFRMKIDTRGGTIAGCEIPAVES